MSRVYKGGKLLDAFLTGKEGKDGYFPEEWICSSVSAIGSDTEGLSAVRGHGITFDRLLKEYREELLGGRKELGVLVKFLDGAVRLPVQAHPDRGFSRKYFGSDHGKTEMWIVLAVRENAKLYIGFNRKITKEEFSDAVERSEHDKEALTGYLNAIDVKPGDVYLIEARTVHAIGAGCLILEIQEPTDFTIQPEYWCDEVKLSERDKYLGLSKEIALDSFDFDFYGKEVVEKAKKSPRVIAKGEDYSYESLISYDDTPFFAVNRITINGGKFKLGGGPAIYVVTMGCGSLSSRDQKYTLNKGDYFFLPCICRDCEVYGNLEIAECLPPK